MINKVVHSFWSGPAISKTGDAWITYGGGGWKDPLLHWYSWILSFYTAKDSYGQVELVTDDRGADVLVNRIGLKYDKVVLALNSLTVDPGLWMYGKLIAYGLQEEPFLHVDGDVFLWKRLPEEYENAQIVVQNLEHPDHRGLVIEGEKAGYSWFDQVYMGKKAKIDSTVPNRPDWWGKFSGDRGAYCLGCFGGQDLETIHGYSREVQAWIEDEGNREGWRALFSNNSAQHYNCSLEQHTFYCYLKSLGIWPMPLFFGDEMVPHPHRGDDRRSDELKYTHIMGGKVGDTFLHKRLIKRVERDFPDAASRVREALKQ